MHEKDEETLLLTTEKEHLSIREKLTLMLDTIDKKSAVLNPNNRKFKSKKISVQCLKISQKCLIWAKVTKNWLDDVYVRNMITLFEIFIFCPKIQLWFPDNIVDFFGVKNSWKCCGFGLFCCWQLWFHEKNLDKNLDKKLVKMLGFYQNWIFGENIWLLE